MHLMPKAWLPLAGLVALCLAIARPAAAQNATFDFSYSGSGVSASGVLDTTLVSGTTDEYYVTGISGERNGDAITGLFTPVPNPPGTVNTEPPTGFGISYDDIVYYPANPSLDLYGIYFNTAGGDSYNVFYQNSGYQDADGNQWIANQAPATPLTNFTITYTPEASSIALLAPSVLLLGGLALFARRRRSLRA